MPMAFVLINADLGFEEEVLKVVRWIGGVEEAYNIYGVYDVIAKIKANTMVELRNLVTRRIRRLNGVRSTLTMIVIEG